MKIAMLVILQINEMIQLIPELSLAGHVQKVQKCSQQHRMMYDTFTTTLDM